MFSKKCKEHYNEVNMTGWQHFKFAWWFIFQLKRAELALLVHSFCPRYFKTYASDKVQELAKFLDKHR